jgi:hypothetical protein
MDKHEFQKKAIDRLNDWYGDSKKTILHTWFDIGIMYAIVQGRVCDGKKSLEFFRVFSLGERIEISRDKEIYL